MSLQYAAVAPKALYVEENLDFEFLDIAMAKLNSGLVEQGMNLLVSELTNLYTTTSTSAWEYALKTSLLNHPIKKILLQDPLTNRALNRPRGYAGDAILMDMIYYPKTTDLSSISLLGRKIYHYNTSTPLSRTLCRRMKLISNYLDKFAKEKPNANILSVASGHCRELKYSNVLEAREIGQFVALDHDKATLEVVNNEYGDLGLKSVLSSVSDIVKGRVNLGTFDLIYSAGLYDYLSLRFAQKLTRQLYNMLSPGGKLMLINIAPNYDEIGFLESYMNWAMIGRGKTELLEVASGLGSDERANLNVYNSSLIKSHYHILEIEKK
ncbi:MAG: class I SAM-dependent methyltransferase [Acidiferrobacterales bacterium]